MSNAQTINLGDLLAAVPTTTTRTKKPAEEPRTIVGPFAPADKGDLLAVNGLTFNVAKVIWDAFQNTDQVIDLRAGTAQGVGDKRRLCVALKIDAPLNDEPLMNSPTMDGEKYAFKVHGRGECNARESGTIASVPSSSALALSILRATSGLHNVRSALISIDSKRVNNVENVESYDAVIVCPNTSNPADVVIAVANALRPQGDALAVALIAGICKQMKIDLPLPAVETKVSVRKMMKAVTAEG